MNVADFGGAVERLADVIAEASVVLPFTGAGISTECGIPDFRSPGGIWTKNRPIPFDEFLASQEARNESWRRRFAMQDEFGLGEPGRGDTALASHPTLSSNCTATRRMRCALIVNSATRSRGCARAWRAATAARPIAPLAAATSRPPPFLSGRPCRACRCSAPKT